jgi:short-subunit dehydrogenase
MNSNINAVTFITRFFLEKLSQQKVKSAVININSATAIDPKVRSYKNSSHYSLYKATKAYTHALSL